MASSPEIIQLARDSIIVLPDDKVVYGEPQVEVDSEAEAEGQDTGLFAVECYEADKAKTHEELDPVNNGAAESSNASSSASDQVKDFAEFQAKTNERLDFIEYALEYIMKKLG